MPKPVSPTRGAAARCPYAAFLFRLRIRPELIVGPAMALWIALEVLPIDSGRPFILTLVQTASFHGNAGELFPLTYACAVSLGTLALVALRNLWWPRRLLVAAAFPFAYTHLYEIPYDLIGRFVWPTYYTWATWPLVLLLNTSWLVLGLSTSIYWRLTPRGLVSMIATLATFAIWWLLFWPQLGAHQPPLNPEGSGYELSKTLLAVTLAFLILDGTPKRKLDEKAPIPPA